MQGSSGVGTAGRGKKGGIENNKDAPILEPDLIFGESPITENPGTVIGRYKLLERVGEGGCGVVYVAEQTEPVRRRVALKVIKLGMDTREVIARFEAERQVCHARPGRKGSRHYIFVGRREGPRRGMSQ